MKAVIINCWGFVNAEKFKRVIQEIFLLSLSRFSCDLDQNVYNLYGLHSYILLLT